MKDGKLQFQPSFLKKEEFLSKDTEVTFIMVDGSKKVMNLDKGSLAFTTCQIPVIYKINTTNKIVLYYKNGETKTFETLELNQEESQRVSHRTNEITLVEVYLNDTIL